MQAIRSRIKQITTKYEELKVVEDPKQKQEIALSLIKLCAETEQEIDKSNPSPLNFRQKTHISSIKNTAIQVNKQCQDTLDKRKRKFDPSSDSKIMVQPRQQELSKKVGRMIVEKEVKSKELKISGSEFEELAGKMQKNLVIQEQIKSMIVEQGGDLQLIQQRLDKVYDNLGKTNAELTDAAQIQMQSRLAKIRLGITGIIALIGYSILGIPGMIFGGIVGLFKSVA